MFSKPIITFEKGDFRSIHLKLEIDDSFREKLPYNFKWNIDEDGNIIGIYYIIDPRVNIPESSIIKNLKTLYEYYTEKISM